MLMHYIAYGNFIYCFAAERSRIFKPQRIKLTKPVNDQPLLNGITSPLLQQHSL
jgi:hypothetical protein